VKNIEKKIVGALVQVLHWIMFGVSAVFSVRLFTLLGSTAADSILYGTLAVAFEGAKITLWEVGNRVQKGVALAFVGISLLASTGVALAISEKTLNMGTDETRIAEFDARVSELTGTIDRLNDQNKTLNEQIAKLPPGYTTSAERLAKLQQANDVRRQEAEAARSAVIEERNQYRASTQQHTEATMFTLLARMLHVSESMFVFVFMFIVSILLEVGALTTTHREEAVPEEARPVPTLSDLATCKCGSRQVSLDRLANGKYVVRCRSCGSNTSITDSEERAREEWKEKIK
jgi:hypothetical protein